MNNNVDTIKMKNEPDEENDGMDNLAGFFRLLLEIDKRINPGFYKKKNKHK